jgi:hypothetical protein
LIKGWSYLHIYYVRTIHFSLHEPAATLVFLFANIILVFTCMCRSFSQFGYDWQ